MHGNYWCCIAQIVGPGLFRARTARLREFRERANIALPFDIYNFYEALYLLKWPSGSPLQGNRRTWPIAIPTGIAIKPKLFSNSADITIKAQFEQINIFFNKKVLTFRLL